MFVLTLGYSRKAVRLLVWKSSSQVWSELHEKAFRRLGGAPRVIVLDNLKEGVLQPDVYDAALNPLYRDVLAHCGVTALPCRVRHPDRKGKVESGVRHAQQKVRGLRFESIEEAQTYLDRWERRWADTRIHGTTKRQVAAMYAIAPRGGGPMAGRSRFGQATRVVGSAQPGQGWANRMKSRFIGKDGYKLIQTPLEGLVELYYLPEDPDEQRNLLLHGNADHRARADALAAELEAWAASAAPLPSRPELEQNRETYERLKALGYVR
jgi:hypothetical protein